MLDTTYAPSNIRYPQDFSLLNEAREKLETIIIRFCKSYGLSRPRMYRKQARKNYLALAKAKNVVPRESEQLYESSSLTSNVTSSISRIIWKTVMHQPRRRYHF